ncbi:hypothetical protein [Halovivax gelatinilyticus]|uniref:hypothetical protein n=1 Tax=Halovivax gelatinilyticus TaxID=2961597 RepID=UPI0020CA31FF|nr:hypothetical protein [Halovivax gelatinilyticus]
METDRPSVELVVLLALGVVTTVVIHGIYVPQFGPDEYIAVLPYLVAGWIAFTASFYAIARLVSEPADLPSMRGADIGVTLVLLSLLLAGALGNYGFTPRAVPTVYVALGIGLYIGLALIGWSLGQRTRAVNRMVADR